MVKTIPGSEPDVLDGNQGNMPFADRGSKDVSSVGSFVHGSEHRLDHAVSADAKYRLKIRLTECNISM